MFGEGLPKAPLRFPLSYACPHPLIAGTVGLRIGVCTPYLTNIHIPLVVLCERNAPRKDCSRQYGYSSSRPPLSETSNAGRTLFEGLSSPSTTFTTVNTMPRDLNRPLAQFLLAGRPANYRPKQIESMRVKCNQRFTTCQHV